jgi:hypothetical protein
MGKRDNEQLGAFLVDRMRGEQSTPPPRHPEATGVAAVADAAARGYQRMDAEGDPEGSRYALMRHIERDVAFREERRLQRGWLFSFATATVCTVIFAGLVLGAYIFGVHQGTQSARSGDSLTPATNVSPGGGNGSVVEQPYPLDDGTKPVRVADALPGDLGNWDEQFKSRVSALREAAVRNGSDASNVNNQTRFLYDTQDQMGNAYAMFDPAEKTGAMKNIVEHLASMDEKFPENELTCWGIFWAAEIASREYSDLGRAQELYGEVVQMCDRLAAERGGSGPAQSALLAMRDSASFNYAWARENRGGTSLFARPSAGETGNGGN